MYFPEKPNNLKPFQIEKLLPSDEETILKIADWYFEEWETPLNKTINRLSGSEDGGLYFQLVAKHKGEVVATGGLSDIVNLQNVYPEYKNYGPWVALLYTSPKFRNQGIGAALLKQIEEEAVRLHFEKIYLYTFTAEPLYRKSGWQPIQRVRYKNHDTVVMEKEIVSISLRENNTTQ